MTLASANRQNKRKGLASATSATNPLLIVESLWRHIRLKNGDQRTDINSNLHRCGHSKKIDQSCFRLDLGYLDSSRSKEDALETALPFSRIVCLASQLFATDSEYGLAAINSLTKKILL
jgi:hypothetical protein